MKAFTVWLEVAICAASCEGLARDWGWSSDCGISRVDSVGRSSKIWHCQGFEVSGRPTSAARAIEGHQLSGNWEVTIWNPVIMLSVSSF